MTGVERKLWSHLRRRRLAGHRVRRQAQIGPYFVDFICLAARLVIEVDGPSHDESGEQDAARDRWLESRGYRVIRFTDDDVFWDCEWVVEVICWALEDAPPPRRGGTSLGPAASAAARSPPSPRRGDTSIPS
jgi:very-short-patch-repair endonuclease